MYRYDKSKVLAIKLTKYNYHISRKLNSLIKIYGFFERNRHGIESKHTMEHKK